MVNAQDLPTLTLDTQHQPFQIVNRAKNLLQKLCGVIYPRFEAELILSTCTVLVHIIN